MAVVDMLIRKQMDLHYEFLLRRLYSKSIWLFYCAYNLSCSYLGYVDDVAYMKKRQRAWVRWFMFRDKTSLNRLLNFVRKDMAIISKCLKKINLEDEEGDVIGDLYIPGTIGMDADDFYNS